MQPLACSPLLALGLSCGLLALTLPVDWLFSIAFPAAHWEALSCCAAHSWAEAEPSAMLALLVLFAQSLLQKNNQFSPSLP